MDLDNLDREDLLFFIGCYNNYVVEFYDDHEEGMQPVSAYEFYENEFQEILKQQADYKEYDDEKLLEEISMCEPKDFEFMGDTTFKYRGLYVKLRTSKISKENGNFYMTFEIFENRIDDNYIIRDNFLMNPPIEYWRYIRKKCDYILRDL